MKQMALCMAALLALLCVFPAAAQDLTASMQRGDKAALLLVHFGTTYDETRAKTIDAINAKAAEAFPELDV
ncbi:MAG: sirohydrochlorin cobaltochelatase, partial [Bacteroidales bacterium]|nr:sirohydrochlorin cobaltochelatase [Bacteroidales bacterium]